MNLKTQGTGWIGMSSLLVSLLSVGGCIGSHGGEKNHSVLDKIKHSEAPQVRATSEKFLAGASYLPAEGISGDPFFVITREDKIEKFACTKCHERSGAKPVAATRDGKAAHWAVSLKHAPSDVMNCKTCHDSQDMDHLRKLGSGSIRFNNSYQLCAQCHFQQAKDWAGGAHGKRVGGWAPPRVIQNCASCHNPHSPQLEKRWPKTAASMPENSKKKGAAK